MKRKAKKGGQTYFDDRLIKFSNYSANLAFEHKKLGLRNHVMHQAFIDNETILSLIRKDKVLLDSS
jgi:hypothetical protein